MTSAWRWSVAAAAIGAATWAQQLQRGGRVEGFRVPDYDDNGVLRSQLYGDWAVLRSPDVVEVENPRVELYRDGEIETRVVSPHCLFNRRTQMVASTSTVRIVRGDVVITGQNYRFEPRHERFVIYTNARVVLRDVRRAASGRLLPGGTAPEARP